MWFCRCLLASVVIMALTASPASLGAPLPPRPGRQDGLLGMKFMRLPKGVFYMGWDGSDKPGRKTEIKDDFEIAMYTVTQGQWQAVMGSNPSWFSRGGGGNPQVRDVTDDALKQFPVEHVSWDDAQQFIKKLNEREKGSGWTYRLPTEAEWEYACRGGATSEEECSHHFYFARPTDDLSTAQANFGGVATDIDAPLEKHLERTSRVGTYAPNKLGLCDMHGNVWQWCQDNYHGSSHRVIRGGSWQYGSSQCRASYCGCAPPSFQGNNIGFRLVRVRSGGR